MRKENVHNAAFEVATQVRAVEDAIETALAEMAELQGRMIRARRARIDAQTVDLLEFRTLNIGEIVHAVTGERELREGLVGVLHQGGWFAAEPTWQVSGPVGKYTRYGYAGYDYTTYDIGCADTGPRLGADGEVAEYEYRARHKDAWARQGVKLTYTAYLVAAAAEAMKAALPPYWLPSSTTTCGRQRNNSFWMARQSEGSLVSGVPHQDSRSSLRSMAAGH